MTAGLWVAPDQFMSFSELENRSGTDLISELYATGFSGFDPVGWFGLMPDPDPVLRKTGDGVSVLRSLTADDKVISCIQNRKLGTLKKKGYRYEPGHLEGSDADTVSASLCRDLSEDIWNINLYDVFSEVLDAPYYGNIPVEIIWKNDGGKLRIANLKPRPTEWFGYNGRHELVWTGGTGLTDTPVAPNKLVVARHFPDAVNPYGLRLLSRCLWPVAIKKGGMRFWTMLCERFGMPWVIGHVTSGDKTKRDEALRNLTSMVRNAVAVVSGDTKVDVHGMEGKGGDLHPALIRYCDMSIARALTGQNLTNEGGSTGSYAESKTSDAALDDYREADEHLLVSFMEDLAAIYRDVNSPAAMSPSFRFIEPEDYTARADLDGKLSKMGVTFKKAHFVRAYQLSEDEFEVAQSHQAGLGDNGTGDAGSEFASGSGDTKDPQDAIDTLTGDLFASAGTHAFTHNEKLILEAVSKSGSYEEAMERLLDLYPDLNADDLTDTLERGLLAAEMFGMWTGKVE